jgi:hypothetical protein
MRLAIQMGRTLEELLNTMSSAELSLWLAKEKLEPLDDPYFRTALLATVTARSMGNKKVKITDFMPKEERKQTAQEHAMILKAWAKRG